MYNARFICKDQIKIVFRFWFIGFKKNLGPLSPSISKQFTVRFVEAV